MSTTEPAADRHAVILIHGLLCDGTVWTHQREALAATFDVVVPELRGFDSLDAMAASTLDGVEGPFHLVGHSMGARVALEIVRTRPERVRSLSLLDTGVHPVGDDEPARRQVLLDLAAAEGIGAVANAWVPPMVHPDRHRDEALMAAMDQMVRGYAVADFEGQIRALLGRADARPLLARITCPTLVACGRQDAWSPLEQHEAIAADIASAELAVIEDSGHMAPMEQPEATTELLYRFLTEAAAST